MDSATQTTRLVIASNRLPFILAQNENGSLTVTPASGGLISAMLPVLKEHGGLWIGWTGMIDGDAFSADAINSQIEDRGFGVIPVSLSAAEIEGFYEGFSNEVVWPLFHDLPSFCNFDPDYWCCYLKVTKRFAKVIFKNILEGDFIWIHDYHLINVAAELRRLGVQQRTAFFLHIPFPALDIFLKLPWRQAILRSLLDYDLVGFQTRRDRRNFLQCLRYLCKDVTIGGKGQVVQVRIGDRQLAVGHFPIGIDFADFAWRAATEEVEKEAQTLRQQLPGGQFILGIDRLDYSKGIPLRLEAFCNALTRYPELRGQVTLIQVVVPSREHIPRYLDLRGKIEQLVSRVNGEFGKPGGWVPIHYVFRSLKPLDLLIYYRAAAIGLVTPLKDGMNLVAKEFCACSIDEECVLILSEFAGSAAQLHSQALLVNPFDIEGIADTIYRAFCMPPAERKRRMRRIRQEIMRRDVFWWVNAFICAATHKNIHFSMEDRVIADRMKEQF